jgi:DNA uptake protein ComE-like DNA-binding protein
VRAVIGLEPQQVAPRDKGWWVALTLVPFGWAIWLAFLIAGVRAHSRRWKAYAVMYALLALVPFAVLDPLLADTDDNQGIIGIVLLGIWGLGIVHAFLVRPAYMRRVQDELMAAAGRARAQVQSRHEALELAQREPEVAREMGIGRPDRPGAVDAGLVDVNSAPVTVIDRLPGIDQPTARRIIAVREQLDGFSSLEDFGMTMDLDGETVEDLRGRVVFLPR